VAADIFNAHMKTPHQLPVRRDDVRISAKDLLAVPEGDITEEGLRLNVDVGIQYLEAWLGGNGCVPIYNLMEDAATAEISRSQVWQWVRHGARLQDGRTVSAELVKKTIPEELEKIRGLVGTAGFDAGHYDLASRLFEDMMTRAEFPEFLTLVAYDHID
jgi:malate synthase